MTTAPAPAEAIAYTFNEQFHKLDMLEHKKFGVGVDTRLLSGDTIEVTFPESKKILIHNRSVDSP